MLTFVFNLYLLCVNSLFDTEAFCRNKECSTFLNPVLQISSFSKLEISHSGL